MSFLSIVLILLAVSVVLLQLSKKLRLPYPSLLAFAGLGLATVPHGPHLILNPQIALAIFVTPALFNAAFRTSPRELLKHWVPLVALAGASVIITVFAVGVVGHILGHLSWAAALTLGAIVSPPDASAVSAVLNRFPLPRRTLLILEGESLLNDASALLFFGIFQAMALSDGSSMWKITGSLLVAVPAGAFLGYALGRVFTVVTRWTAGTLSASIAEVTLTFAAWVAAERLHVSPILSVVVLAMTIARSAPRQQMPRDRVQSVAVWGSMTFAFSALAFLLLGMQVADIARHLHSVSLRSAIVFGLCICVVTVLVRIAWVFLYRVLFRRILLDTVSSVPSARISFFVSWCGIRGLVTIATASSLPIEFPARDLIVFAAFMVVLGTLVIQGFTIGPLVTLLGIQAGNSLQTESHRVRTELLETGLAFLRGREGPSAENLRSELRSAVDQMSRQDFSARRSHMDRVRIGLVEAQREKLIELRDSGQIQEDIFQLIEEELDWNFLAATPSDDLTLEEI